MGLNRERKAERRGVADMTRRIYSILAAALFVFVSCAGCAKAENPQKATSNETSKKTAAAQSPGPVFTCTSAGRWFTGNPAELRDMVDRMLADASPIEIKGRIVSLISPHAGFIYSGPVAAHGYKAIAGKEYDTVIVVGFSHGVYDPGIAVFESGAFRTPLGDIPIDAETTSALVAAGKGVIRHNPTLFKDEHSVDNQLPFLQAALGEFSLVPVIMGNQSKANIDILADALAKALEGRNALMVASSDMSHFWPQNEAKRLDRELLEKVQEMDEKGIAEIMKEDPTGRRMCGHGAAQAVIRASRKLGSHKAAVLKYATSQDTFGATGQGVVGYMSAALFNENPAIPSPKKSDGNPGSATNTTKEDVMPEMDNASELDEKSQNELLAITRKSLESTIRKGVGYEPEDANPALRVKRGMFVTLNKNEQLRGCMGHFEPDTPIFKLAASQVIVSATRDPRFPPVRPEELDSIHIEISVLSQPAPASSYKDIEIGKHGVILECGWNASTFLPQVAPEQGWNRDEMLSHLAMKAGLPPDGWKRDNCKFLLYTAQVFGE